MKEEEIIKKLQSIFNDIFINTKVKVTRKLNASKVNEWDSLNQINLIIAIEKEFNIKFSVNDIQSMDTVGDTIDIIIEKI